MGHLNAPVAYEFEFYRNTKDGDRSRVWRVTYDSNWEDFVFHEMKSDSRIRRLEIVSMRPLAYAEPG